ncbi:GNT1 [Acrasis kona]|uniref:GNT1 n=1 Tax=Acrasis kona TaxID=1008807 RepID=A0AAW2ZCQ1_9EUKA
MNNKPGTRNQPGKTSTARIIIYLVALLCSISFIVTAMGAINKNSSYLKSLKPYEMEQLDVSERAINTRGLPTIFVSIAAYRDPQCMYTLLWALKQAKYPERVFFGIVQQNHPDMDVDCLSVSLEGGQSAKEAELLIKYRKQIRMLRVSYLDARGPAWARYKVIHELFKKEDYVLQVDSHTRFVPNWDEAILNNIKQLPEKSAISHYPSVFDPRENSNGLPNDYEKVIARMCKGFYNGDGILQPVAGLMGLDKKESKSCPFLGAGFTFYPGIVHDEIQMDPFLPYLFHGEELLFSMRLVSKGYKFYSPAENIVFHFYYRKDFPKYWDLSSIYPDYSQLQRYSLQRTKYIIGMLDHNQVENATWTLQEIDKYGIDWKDEEVKKRMDRYFEVFEIDLKNQKMGDFCGKGLPDW